MADPNKTKVTILTGTYRIKGYIELMAGARVTDYMVEAKDFIAVKRPRSGSTAATARS